MTCYYRFILCRSRDTQEPWVNIAKCKKLIFLSPFLSNDTKLI